MFEDLRSSWTKVTCGKFSELVHPDPYWSRWRRWALWRRPWSGWRGRPWGAAAHRARPHPDVAPGSQATRRAMQYPRIVPSCHSIAAWICIPACNGLSGWMQLMRGHLPWAGVSVGERGGLHLCSGPGSVPSRSCNHESCQCNQNEGQCNLALGAVPVWSLSSTITRIGNIKWPGPILVQAQWILLHFGESNQMWFQADMLGGNWKEKR